MSARGLRLYLHNIAPEIFSLFKNGYSLNGLSKDIYAGLVVAIISFPLAMALAIASGASPDKGLITAVVSGALTSLCGGSRYQIGGPTGAFVVIIFNIIQTHGYEGLILATLMAGVMLVISGVLGVGKIIQYIPYTVTAGFTAGIGITILSTQLHDLLGIKLADTSGNFIERISFITNNVSEVSIYAIVLGVAIAAMIFLLQKYKSSYPRFLIALAVGIGAVVLFTGQFETVGSRFTDLKWSGFSFVFPNISFELVKDLFPSAITIAFLAGIESLLCCMIADSLTSTKHKSDSELIGQGISNIFSALLGGLPATGALARTAANIKAGAVSSISGIFQAVFVFSFMCFLLGYMTFIPIACLAGMLVTIAWNMIGFKQCLYIFHSSKSDVAVFLLTLVLTVVVDITVAVEVGVLTAVFLFVKRLIDRTEVEISHIANSQPSLGNSTEAPRCSEIQCVNIKGPLFFGLAPMVDSVLKKVCKSPEVIVLNFEDVPLIDATGARIIRQLVANSKKAPVILTNLRKYPFKYLQHIDYKHEKVYGHLTQTMSEAIILANEFIANKKNGNTKSS